MKRDGIKYPKFTDHFALMDFEAEPMPVLSFFPVPETRELGEWEVTLTGVAGERRSIGGKELQALPRVREKSPFECQIFNWAEEPEVEGLRLVDLLDATGVDAPDGEYFSFYSADGLYFEGLPRTMARDPRTLLVFGLDHNPLPSLGAVRTGLQECEVAPHDSSFSARPRRDQKAARPEPYGGVGSRRPEQGRPGLSQTQQRGNQSRNLAVVPVPLRWSDRKTRRVGKLSLACGASVG